MGCSSTIVPRSERASALPAPTAANINEAHRLARTSAETAVEHAIRCGLLLAAMKEEVGHGNFIPWVEERCDFGARVARKYMQVARLADQNGTAVPFSSLNQLLAPPAPKEQPTTESKVKGGQAKADAPKPSPTADAGVHASSAGPRVAAAPEPPEDPEFAEESAELERAEREYQDRMAKVIESDDRLAAASAEIKKLSGLYAAVARERDRAQNEQGRLTRLLKAAERKIDRLEREIAQLREKAA